MIGMAMTDPVSELTPNDGYRVCSSEHGNKLTLLENTPPGLTVLADISQVLRGNDTSHPLCEIAGMFRVIDFS